MLLINIIVLILPIFFVLSIINKILSPVDNMLHYNNYLNYLLTTKKYPSNKDKSNLPAIPTYIPTKPSMKRGEKVVYISLFGYIMWFLWFFVLALNEQTFTNYQNTVFTAIVVYFVVVALDYFILPLDGKKRIEEIDITKWDVRFFVAQHVLKLIPYVILYYTFIKLI
jgi:hypothetical protein